MKKIYVEAQEARLLMQNLNEVKLLIGEAEFRLNKKHSCFKEINHPFFYIPYKKKEVILIGSKNEVKFAEKEIEKFIKAQMSAESLEKILISNFVLPVWTSSNLAKAKQTVMSRVLLCFSAQA